MADLVTRLLLNSSNFDNNIVKSTQQVKQFQAIGKTVGASLKSSFMMAAGGAGIAMSGMEAFNKLMSHSQAMTDGFNIKMEQAKSHTDSFFASVANGNLNSFINGWQNINKSAETYSKALDDAGTATAVITPEIELHKTKYDSLMAKAKDVSLSEKDRLNYLNLANNELTDSINLQRQLVAIQNQADYTELNSKFASETGTNIRKKDLDKALKVEDNGKAHYSNWIDDYDKKLSALKKKIQTFSGSSKDYDKLKEQYFKSQGNSTYKYYKGLDAIENSSKELFTKYKMGIVKFEQINTAADEANKQMALAKKRIKNGDSGNGSGGKKDKELSPEQSIAYYNQELTKANKEFNSAVSDSARAAIQAKIEQLKEVIRVMEFKANHTSLPTTNDSNGSMSGHTSLKVKANPTAGLIVQPIYTKKDVATTNDYANALNATANAMATLNTAMNGGNKTFLSFAAVSGGAIAQMIIQLQALAGAKGIASAFSMPFPANIAAVATVVSTVASVFASLPKFAEGGIFQGSSTIGDMSLARVNAGEMILNTSQQANLFNMLNSGNNATTSKGGKVEFEIRADKLYGVLKNYDLKMSKLR